MTKKFNIELMNKEGGAAMSFDYSKLLGRIVEVCGTQAKFAEEMGLSERSISLKLNNKRGWKQEEMKLACGVLALSDSEIPQYFFNA